VDAMNDIVCSAYLANYFEKTSGEKDNKMLTLYMRHPWRIKLKKHPVFFTHFIIFLTGFSDKIKPMLCTTYNIIQSTRAFK